MILYLDSSALVKIYVEEPKSVVVRENAEQAGGLATSRIAYAEAMPRSRESAGNKVCRVLIIRTVVNDLDQDWPEYFIVDVSEGVVQAAGILAESHALRGAVAIHLASAVLWPNRRAKV